MAEPNAICPICGKPFHAKPSHLKRYKTVCCSMECSKIHRSRYMSGKGNHQYGLRGDKNASFKNRLTRRQNNKNIDLFAYAPDHPFSNRSGRVKVFRLIVEENYEKFDEKYFVEIDGKHYLRPEIHVHHIDGNHANNSKENLMPVTKAEHRRFHNIESPQTRGEDGRFCHVKTGEIVLKVKRVHPDAKLPKRMTHGSAGLDLCAVSCEELGNNLVKYDTGLAFEIPHGYVGLLYPRSSIFKYGLMMANSVGVIDSDYRSTVSAIFVKLRKTTGYTIGDRMCQLVIQKVPLCAVDDVEILSETVRGTGGYGSTGR